MFSHFFIKLRKDALISFVFIIIVASVTPASAEVFIRQNFEGSAPEFGWRVFSGYELGNGNYSGSWNTASDWLVERVPNGGWNETAGAHIVLRGGRRQYNFGWYTGYSHNWIVGESAFIRFRMKFDDNFRWDNGSQSIKMSNMGIGGDRIIIFNRGPNESLPCCGDDGKYDEGRFSIGRGITEVCAGPANGTYGEWLHIQMEAKSGQNGTGSFKIWVNNNDYDNPTAVAGGFSFGVTNWSGQFNFGEFMTDPPARNQGFIYDDFELANTWASSWFPDTDSDDDTGDDTGDDDTGDDTGDDDTGDDDTGDDTGDDDTGDDDTGDDDTGDDDTGDDTGGDTSGSVFWSSDFENGNFNEWNRGTRGDLSIIAQDAQSGNYCARSVLTGGTHSDNYADHVFGDFYNVGDQKIEEIYLITHSKFDSGYVWPSNGQKIAIFNLTNGDDSQRRYQVYVKVNTNGQYAVDHSYIGTWEFFGLPQNQGSPASVRSGQWDKIKLYVRLNTPGSSDGIVKLWVNDVLKLYYNNVNIRQNTSYGINKLIMSSYATDASGSDGYQYFDNWQLATADPDDSNDGNDSIAVPENLRIMSPSN
jgi:hypothetical protein